MRFVNVFESACGSKIENKITFCKFTHADRVTRLHFKIIVKERKEFVMSAKKESKKKTFNDKKKRCFGVSSAAIFPSSPLQSFQMLYVQSFITRVSPFPLNPKLPPAVYRHEARDNLPLHTKLLLVFFFFVSSPIRTWMQSINRNNKFVKFLTPHDNNFIFVIQILTFIVCECFCFVHIGRGKFFFFSKFCN